jgi:hypothetical protein
MSVRGGRAEFRDAPGCRARREEQADFGSSDLVPAMSFDAARKHFFDHEL